MFRPSYQWADKNGHNSKKRSINSCSNWFSAPVAKFNLSYLCWPDCQLTAAALALGGRGRGGGGHVKRDPISTHSRSPLARKFAHPYYAPMPSPSICDINQNIRHESSNIDLQHSPSMQQRELPHPSTKLHFSRNSLISFNVRYQYKDYRKKERGRALR